MKSSDRVQLAVWSFVVASLALLAMGGFGFQAYSDTLDARLAQASAPAVGGVHATTKLTCERVPRSGGFSCDAIIPDVDPYNRLATQDLRAQQDMSKWALALVVIGAASMVLSVGGVLLLLWTLRATREAARAAVDAADAAREANAGFADHSMRELRAYVSLVDAEMPAITEGQRARIILRFVNSGATPATSMRLLAAAVVLPVDFDRDLGGWAEVPDEEFAYRELSAHGGDTRIDAITDELTSEAWAQIADGRAGVFVFGRGAYKDVFDRWHWLRYQAYITSPPASGSFPLYFCSVGNGAN